MQMPPPDRVVVTSILGRFASGEVSALSPVGGDIRHMRVIAIRRTA
jgi:hypothetical protein